MKEWGITEKDEYVIITEYNSNTNYYDVSVFIDSKKVESIKKSYYNAHKNKFDIKGFRKGKAGRKQAEKMLGGQEAIYSMTFGAYATSIMAQVCPYKIMHITNQDAKPLRDGRWKLSCSVLTEHPVDDIDSLLEGMDLQIPQLYPKEYVDYKVEKFRKLNPYLHIKDGVVEEGDMVEVSIVSKIDNEVYEPGCEDKTNIRVVKDAVHIDELYDKLLGSSKNDTLIVSTNHVKELSNRFGIPKDGNSFSIEVLIRHVYTCEEPLIDDDLAISAGYSNLQEWISRLHAEANRIIEGNEEKFKRAAVVSYLESNSEHPELSRTWALESLGEEETKNGVSTDYIDRIRNTARQLIILKLVGQHIGIDYDDDHKHPYERNEEAYAEKVLQYLVEEKARFSYADEETTRNDREDRGTGEKKQRGVDGESSKSSGKALG